MTLRLSVLSWNIHRTRGRDGRADPARILSMMETRPGLQAADILTLQEADQDCRPHRALLEAADLERATGLRHAHAGPTLRWGGHSLGFLGVVVLLRPGLEVRRAELIDLPGHCHRGAVVIVAEGGGRMFRLIATHLSLSQVLRIAQMRIIGQYMARQPMMPTILAGDLNEWRPWGGLALSRAVTGRRWQGPRAATFPAARPLLTLDRVAGCDGARVLAVRAVTDPGISLASDHLPLRADVSIGDG
ncbi:MAG: endonuclease/exonuclease/phosphatase family protein [Paracoccaceae bacterium]|nr:MAG: endonuclease/exonuclease/phosphatase family protein [Paracoccaceae bacterium]